MDEVLIGAFFASTGSILLFLRHMRDEIMTRITVLDGNLAEALQKTLGELPIGDFEPPNPMQMLLTQLVSDRLNPQAVIVQEKDEKGLFSRSKPAN